MEQVFSERLARFELQQILEISRREAEPVGTVVHRKAMSVTEQTGLDAVVDEAAEFAHKVSVLVFARNELTFIVTRAIVQKQFNEPRNERTTVRIDGMVQFLIDIVEVFYYSPTFALRQMESFLLAVKKESVVVDVPVKSRAKQQIGMVSQPASRYLPPENGINMVRETPE